jgi:hypothetical protein
MAKGIRSKSKRRNRAEFRNTIGQVRKTAHILTRDNIKYS